MIKMGVVSFAGKGKFKVKYGNKLIVMQTLSVQKYLF